jgi:hypothetical protein
MHANYKPKDDYLYIHRIIKYNRFMKPQLLACTLVESDYFNGVPKSDVFIEQDYIPKGKEKVLLKFNAVRIYHDKG